MAPNSEDDPRVMQKGWSSEVSEKEPQRPPVYNPEDYALSLKKWGRKGNAGLQLPLYISQSTGSIERLTSEIVERQSSPSTKSSNSSKNGDERQRKEKDLTAKSEKQDKERKDKNKENQQLRGSREHIQRDKDFRNPMLTLAPQGEEMSLRQFSSVTELLGKLKVDLKMAFPSFVQEFVGDPVDGVTLLLELLRAVQLSQAAQQQRCPPQILRRALLDEHSCLICLRHCLRCPDAGRRLASSPAGLFTLAVCIMSNVTKSRIIALELLTKACEPPAGGHAPVSEALSTLRLRFGEPVRFRFLAGMMNSAGAAELLAAGMRFINAFVETAGSVQQRVYIQAELQQAGFNGATLRKTLPSNSEAVKQELSRWEKNYFDVEALQSKVGEMEALRDKVQLLERKIQILQEEKGILMSLEQCLKERCSELEEEVSIKTSTTTLTKSTAHVKPFRNADYYRRGEREKGESTPAEDEGISSSEQELSQDEDLFKGNLVILQEKQEKQPLREVKSEPKKPPRAALSLPKEKMTKPPRVGRKMKETNVDDGNEVVRDEEEETTIEEVIEELRNIVNDAESQARKEAPAKPPKTYLRKREEEKNRTFTKAAYEKECEEAEIIPSILLPQPPRRTRSLVHIFLPGREYDDAGKNEFFDEDTDSESSDSLLTREKRQAHKNCHHRALDVTESFNSSSTANTRTMFIKQEEERGFEERNIDEEEAKRRHLKDVALPKAPELPKNKPKLSEKFTEAKRKTIEENRKNTKYGERLIGGFNERLIDGPMSSPYEKSTSFQGVHSCIGNVVNESPFVRRTQRFIPIPVKRSQTFHIAGPDNSRLKRAEMKPKPKMGVSGLDGNKAKSEYAKNYQNVDYKKNGEKKVENDRYMKRMTKEKAKSGEKKEEKSRAPVRRGSFDGLFFVTEFKKKDSAKKRNDDRSKSNTNLATDYGFSCQQSDDGLGGKKLRSKSLERMDEGLDSMVDIVISPEQKKVKASNSEWCLDISKNIGPRTRRSLAESSLFVQPQVHQINNLNKPPQPAQRTSLARQNSASSAPLHLPVEIKVPPRQLSFYNYKSEDSLLSSTPPTRYPPDGSSSPMDFPGTHPLETTPRKISNSSKSGDDSPIYATPVKHSKLQKFFGNPKFDNSVGNEGAQHQNKYFESNYACAPLASERSKAVSPLPRNLQNIASNVKNLMTQSAQKPKATDTKDKMNFFLGNYQTPKPSVSPKNSLSPPPGPPSSPTPLTSFNNAFLVKRGLVNAGLYSGGREDVSGGYKSPAPSEHSHSSTAKVTDSPSGLY